MSNQDTMPVSKLTQTFDDWAIAPPDVDCLVRWLAADGDDKEMLYRAADQARARFVGEDIHLRGIIEFSNICRLNCNYCGIRAKNTAVERYRLDKEEIIELAFRAELTMMPFLNIGGTHTLSSVLPLLIPLSGLRHSMPLFRVYRCATLDIHLIACFGMSSRLSFAK